MKELKHTSKRPRFVTVMVLVIAAVAFLIYIVSVVQTGAGPTFSRASRNDFLTAGDDPLSLEQDLNKLEADPEPMVEQELNAIQ